MDIIELIKNTDPILLTGYLISFFGLLIFLFSFRAINRAKSSINWEKTKGVILSSKLIVHTGTGDSASRTYKPRVEYQYTLRDRIYKSKRVYFGSNIMTTFKKKKSGYC